jgi:hypothetical protein
MSLGRQTEAASHVKSSMGASRAGKSTILPVEVYAVRASREQSVHHTLRNQFPSRGFIILHAAHDGIEFVAESKPTS